MQWNLKDSGLLLMEMVWDLRIVFHSYILAVIGCHCTVQIMEKWRRTSDKEYKHRWVFLWAASVAFGGCALWATHYTGMTAMKIRFPIPVTNITAEELQNCTNCIDSTGNVIYTYEGVFWLFSLLSALISTWIGLVIASKDQYFTAVEEKTRKEMLLAQLQALHMSTLTNKESAARIIKLTALTSNMRNIVWGGILAGFGVVGTHTMGMIAQDLPCELEGNFAVLLASLIFACVSTTVAFWIIFRVVTFWSDNKSLRLGSILLMALAIWGTQYAGLFGVSYYYYPPSLYTHVPLFRLSSHFAGRISTQGGIMCCYFLFSAFVLMRTKPTSPTPSESSVGEKK